MALDPNARILTGTGITLPARNNREIVVITTATFTVDLGVTELEFPDPAVAFIVPRLGTIAYQVGDGTSSWWTNPVDIRLTEQIMPIVPQLLNLEAVSLVPAVGCQLDAVSQYVT